MRNHCACDLFRLFSLFVVNSTFSLVSFIASSLNFLRERPQ